MASQRRYHPGIKAAVALKSGPPVEHLPVGEGVDDAPSEANFKTKASEQGPTSIRGRWIVIVAGGHRLCGPWWTSSKLAYFRQRRWQSSLP
jgi:hypothetical protein